MLYKCKNCEETTNWVLDGQAVEEKRDFTAHCGACGHTNIIRVSVHPPPNDRYKDEEWLREEYRSKTMSDIADQCGVSAMTIYQWLKRHNIATRKRGKRL